MLQPVTDKRWRASPLIQASCVVHAGAACGLLLHPAVWPWALGAIVADHLALTAAGLWPRSQLLGPNWTRLPGKAANAGVVAITIDDGPDPDITPRVLDLLNQHNARATFFCVGDLVRRHAPLAREIVARGHSIENHSQQHLHRFSVLGPRALAREIGLAQETIAAVTGESPRFFRAPAGLRNVFLEPVLAHLGLRLTSWTRRGFDTVESDAQVVLRRLTHGLCTGDILLLHDGHAARTRAGIPVILEVLPRLLSAVAAARLEPVTLRSALP